MGYVSSLIIDGAIYGLFSHAHQRDILLSSKEEDNSKWVLGPTCPSCSFRASSTNQAVASVLLWMRLC